MSQLKYFTAATGSPFTPSAVSGTTITVSSTTNLLAGMSVENATAGINTTISSITNSTQFVVASATGITTSTALNIGTWVTATVGAQGATGPTGPQGSTGAVGATGPSNTAWSASGDSNLAFSSATNSAAAVSVSGGFTNYLVCYNGFEGASAASANGNIYNLSYSASGSASISSGGGNQAFAYSPGSTTNRPSWGNIRVITMSGTGSFTLTPVFSASSGTGYANSTYITVVGLS